MQEHSDFTRCRNAASYGLIWVNAVANGEPYDFAGCSGDL